MKFRDFRNFHDFHISKSQILNLEIFQKNDKNIMKYIWTFMTLNSMKSKILI